ncbi:MAG: HAD-IIIA family hydrolase [Kiritimatiellia bacterium]|jgi:D-glycero-D-manno-heptose 1,7-bisphosphate phosphatase
MTRAALFLDRDDTIVRDLGYIGNPDQITLLPGVADALRKAAAAFRLYLVTNQSGIGRGYYTLAEAEACNRRTLELLELPPPGFHGICIAPERPDQPSRYRKPSPAYVLERIEADGLDPARCHVIGDKRSDIECGLAADVGAILVGLPDGNYRPDALDYAHAHDVPCFPGLPEAIDHVLDIETRRPTQCGDDSSE